MTFDNFADILVMSRVIAPPRLYRTPTTTTTTLENVRAAYRRLTTPTDVWPRTGRLYPRKPEVKSWQ